MFFIKQSVIHENIISKPKIIKSNIIIESIFKKDKFINLFNIIKSIFKFRCLKLIDICNYFPINWKIRLNLLNGYNKKNLLIFNIDYFDNIIVEAIQFLINDYLKIPIEYQKELSNEIFNNILADKSGGCYFTITGITNYGIMFLDKNKLTDEIFIHEFIHYYQDVTGKDINNFKINFNKIEFPQNLNLFLLYKNQNDLSDYLKIITHNNELIPYINNLIFQLNKYFGNKKLYEIKNEIDNLFMQDIDITNENYINKIYKTDICKYLINNKESLIPLLLLILCNIYDKNILTFKTHLYSAF